METPVLNAQGEKVGSCELAQTLFGLKPKADFLYEYVTAYMANQRSGTACVKTRAEVSGGGKKPWKQKHTGRARHGSTRSPIWRKGGVTFGPRPHSFRREMPAAKRQLALAQSLSEKYAQGNVLVLDKLELSAGKTKELAAVLAALKAGKKTLLITFGSENVSRAASNLSGLCLRQPCDLNAYAVLRSEKVVFTKDALEKFAGPKEK